MHYKVLIIVINVNDASYKEFLLHKDEVSTHQNH